MLFGMTKSKKDIASTEVGLILYQGKSGDIELRGDFTRETVWATLDQIAYVFERDKSVISRHFKNIFSENELERDAVVATKTLRAHLVDGYTINRARVGQNYDAFMKAVANVQSVLPEHVVLDPKQVLELIKEFASTWMSLDAYDKNALKPVGSTKKAAKLTADELWVAIGELRTALMKKGEATDLFARERHKEGLSGIVGNVMQSFGG